jgi:hypothetical protein
MIPYCGAPYQSRQRHQYNPLVVVAAAAAVDVVVSSLLLLLLLLLMSVTKTNNLLHVSRTFLLPIGHHRY